MNRPDDEEMHIALDTAERMRVHDVDPHHVAHALLYLNQRNERLRDVLHRVDRYIRFGLPESELTKLRRLIQKLREEEEYQETVSEIRSSVLL